MMAPIEVVDAARGNYVYFCMLLQGSMVPIEVE